MFAVQRLVMMSSAIARAFQPRAAVDVALFRKDELVRRFTDAAIVLEARIDDSDQRTAGGLYLHRKLLVTEFGATVAQRYRALAYHWLGPQPVGASSLEFRLKDFTRSAATPHELWHRTIGEVGLATIHGHQCAVADASDDFTVHPDYRRGELHQLIPRVRTLLAEFLAVESLEEAAQEVGMALTSEDEIALDL